jgi:hypothetical protein
MEINWGGGYLGTINTYIFWPENIRKKSCGEDGFKNIIQMELK